MRLIKLIVCFSLIACVGCAGKVQVSEVPNDYSFKGSIISNSFSISKERIIEDVLGDLGNEYSSDSYTKNYLVKILDSKLKSKVEIPDSSTCNQKENLLNEILKNRILEIFKRSVRYRLKYNSATGTDIKPKHLWYAKRTGVNNNIMTYEFISPMCIKWFSKIAGEWSSQCGFVKMSVRTEYTCSNNKLSFVIKPFSYSIKEPTLLLGGQKMTTHWIDWEKFNSEISNRIEPVITIKNSKNKYNEIFQNLSARLRTLLANRFKYSDKTDKVEKLVKLSPEIIKSRLQRRLEYFRYDSNRTRYEFNETKSFPFNNSSKIITILKIYPEQNNTSSIVVSLKYRSVFDSFKNQDLFGEKEARNYLAKLLRTINRVISK